MTQQQARTGRRDTNPAAGAMRTRLQDPINRLVLTVGAVAIALATAVTALLADRGSVLTGVGVPGPWLLAGLVVLTCLAEITVVRLRHGDAVEELSLYEAALVLDVLLLPPAQALAAAALGLLLASVVQRRPVVKAAFNLGTYMTAVAALIAVLHLVGGAPGELTARVLLGVCLGSIAFTAINLCWLARILGIVNGVSPWKIVRAEAKLSAYMAVGTVATGLITTEIGLHSPLLLPLMAMPALAVTYAYRAAAQEAEERARSASLLQLSHALAERQDVVRRFVQLVREAFDADVAEVALEGAGIVLSADINASDELRSAPIPDRLARVLTLDRPTLVTEDLPADVRQMLAVPVQLGGRRFGVAVLTVRGRRRARMSTRDLTLFAPLADALAAAMQGAEHLDRLVEETSKLQAIVEQSTEGILVVDGDGEVHLWSRALTELTGVSSADAAGRHVSDLFLVPDADEQQLLLPVSAARPRTAVELTVQRPDGELRRLRLAHSAVFADGVLVRDVVVVSDLTQQYRTERLKSDFIATVSHELRTPLTPIIGYVNLLRTRGEKMTPQKRSDSLALIADRAAHLSRLVEDLLLASRIDDAGTDLTMHVTPGVHDLVGIVRQVVGDLDRQRVALDLPEQSVLTVCDNGRALQVAANLVGNALKYSPESTEVGVAMWVEDGMAHVAVSDRGRGIPADQLEKIFEKFHRVDDPMTMTTSGTGLGLFIARRLAQAMGGDVTVRSTLNVGSVFTLTLPLAVDGAAPDSPRPDGSAAGQRTSDQPTPAHRVPAQLGAQP